MPDEPESANEASLLAFRNVEKRFGDTVAVKNLNLEIAAGDFVAIMGPSGCGKTTTLRMLAGLEKPTGGCILWRGRPIDNVPPWRRRMPLVWQNYALFPFLDVLGNVAFGLRSEGLGKAERRKRAMEWLERLGISELAGRSVDTLSGGQAQRVALARALVLEPEVLLLDEPLSALDAHMVVRMQSELSTLQRELGITFFYVTHNQSEAFAMAGRVVIMNDGEIQQVGSPVDIFRAPANRFVAAFVGTNNILPGTVTSVADGSCTVRTVLGTFDSAGPSASAVTEGDKVDLVVSADLVMVLTDPAAARPNLFCARLVGESFIGTTVLLTLDAGDREVKVQLPQRAFQNMRAEIGDELRLCFDPSDALLISA